MTKETKPKYVLCKACDYRVSQEGYDPHTDLCTACNNTREVADPSSILCNMCGGCMCPLGTINEQVPHGLYKTRVVGGYNSYHLFDMTQYTFSFCEKCLRQMFNQCKIHPIVNDHHDGETTYQKDKGYYDYNIWKDTGGHHQAYLNRKCNLIKDCPNEAMYTTLSDGEFTEDCRCEEHKDMYLWNGTSITKFIPPNLKAFL